MDGPSLGRPAGMDIPSALFRKPKKKHAVFLENTGYKRVEIQTKGAAVLTVYPGKIISLENRKQKFN